MYYAYKEYVVKILHSSLVRKLIKHSMCPSCVFSHAGIFGILVLSFPAMEHINPNHLMWILCVAFDCKSSIFFPLSDVWLLFPHSSHSHY